MIARGVPLARRRPARARAGSRCPLVPARRPTARQAPAAPKPFNLVRDYRAERSRIKVFDRIPRGGIEVPVMGISLRNPHYPDNVHELRVYLHIGDDLGQRPRLAGMLKRGEFRDTVVGIGRNGRLWCQLIPEPDNPADPCAVQVWAPGIGKHGLLGYLPARSHRAPAVAVARQLAADPRPGGHPAFACWVTRVREHGDHPDHPGVDVMIRPFRPKPAP